MPAPDRLDQVHALSKILVLLDFWNKLRVIWHFLFHQSFYYYSIAYTDNANLSDFWLKYRFTTLRK